MRRLTSVLIAAAAALVFTPAHADAAIAPTLFDSASCERIEPARGKVVYKCDDGVPPAGGTNANEGGVGAVTVPANYGGDGYTGLPPAAGDQGDPGADSDGNIALDVNVWLPGRGPGKGGYPILFFMHGCCGGDRTGWEAGTTDAPGERWHYNAAWFASRGYVVVSYTARGFVNRENRGSTGYTQLDSRRYEINDYQHLACQVLAEAPEWRAISDRRVAIDPRRVVATGGSYGGGWSWLTITDPTWRCNESTGAAGKKMRLVVAAPKYGWTDLVYTLVPNGLHSQSPGELPATDGCDSGPLQLDGSPCPAGGAPIGVPKSSIIAGLYGTGNLLASNHTTFPPSFAEAVACLTSSYPLEPNPLCEGTLAELLPEFLRDRSAYYQNEFFNRIKKRPRFRVPIFNAGTFTDPLFPSYENRRMLNRLLATAPRYPIRSVFGDYQHFALNKAMEWGDICDTGDERGRHVCETRDYPGQDFDARPAGLVRVGITSRLNRFLDHYARPRANPRQSEPNFNVVASLRTCDREEPGRQFSARRFEQLAPRTLRLTLSGTQTTTSKVIGNEHALSADPVVNDRTNGNGCVRESGTSGAGVASYTSAPLETAATMIGSTEATVRFSHNGALGGLQLNSRLYDVEPDGTATMIDRGTRRLTGVEVEAGGVTLQLHGNAWRFEPGHRIRIELAQDDQPYVRSTDALSSLTLSEVRLAVPVRERQKPRR